MCGANPLLTQNKPLQANHYHDIGYLIAWRVKGALRQTMIYFALHAHRHNQDRAKQNKSLSALDPMDSPLCNQQKNRHRAITAHAHAERARARRKRRGVHGTNICGESIAKYEYMTQSTDANNRQPSAYSFLDSALMPCFLM